MKGILLFFLLIVQSAYFAFAQPAATNQRLFDTIPFIPEHYTQKVAEFNKQPVVTGEVMFLGNSITEMGQWSELLGDDNIINRGISGDITFGVLKRLPDVVLRKPSKLFLMIGINDIGKDIPDTVIAENIRKIVLDVQAKSPATKIYIQSILPVNPTLPNFPQHYAKQAHILSTNLMIRKVAEETHCKYIDLFPLFLDENQLMNRNYTMEGLHLNPAGYAIWTNYLRENHLF